MTTWYQSPWTTHTSKQPLLEPVDPILKLQETVADVLQGISLLASKTDLADLSRSIVVATSRITSLEQLVASSSTMPGVAPRHGGHGILGSPPPHQPPPSGDSSATATAGGGVPRFYKLKFTKFDGRDDPLNWLNHCEQFFRGSENRRWQSSVDGNVPSH